MSSETEAGLGCIRSKPLPSGCRKAGVLYAGFDSLIRSNAIRQSFKPKMYMENQTKQLPVIHVDPPYGCATALWVDGGGLIGVIQAPMVWGESTNISPQINRLLEGYHGDDTNTSVCTDVNAKFEYWDEKCIFSYQHDGKEYQAELTWVNYMAWNMDLNK
jgi:hypothetical protein